jgi:hypothetical protein
LDDRNAPATKGDIADLSERLDGFSGRLDDFGGRLDDFGKKLEQHRIDTNERFDQLRSEMNHGYNDIVERIHDSQTAVLKAFYSYAEGNNKRVTELEDDGGAVRRRLAVIEDRILAVEMRLNMPPAA